ncbi:hypothetical protein [Paenibacillus sp. GCM10012306]|uniref:hypothetical protein n=1 Tax=Paenibacillus sp. GCM10012306 TaxID=3317342 RepID=UPI003617049A
MNNPEGGTPLNHPEGQRPDPEPAQKQSSVTEQWNTLLQDERVQQARQASKQYYSFFASTLTRPYRTMLSVGSAQFQHGLITLSLVAVLSSLYFLTWFLKWGITPAIGPGFLKPLLLTVLGLAVAYGAGYAILRLEKVSFDPKLLLARFGTLLIPAVAVLLLAIIFLALSLTTFSMYLLFLSYLFIFVALNTVIFQYPIKTSAGPVDTLFTLVIANGITAYIFFKLMTSVIAGVIGGFFGSLSPFGF